MRKLASLAALLLPFLANPAAAVPVDVIFHGFAGPAHLGGAVFPVGSPVQIRLRLESAAPATPYEPGFVFYYDSVLELEISPATGSSILASGGAPGVATVQDDWAVPNTSFAQDEFVVFQEGPFEGPVPDGTGRIVLLFSSGGTFVSLPNTEMLTSTALPTAPFDYSWVTISFEAVGQFRVYPTLAEAPEPAPLALLVAALVALRRSLGRG